MKYVEYKVSGITDADTSDIVVAELSDWEFDSFSDYNVVDGSVSCYIPEEQQMKQAVEIAAYLEGTGYPYTVTSVADDTNWNSVWESNFTPILVDGRCYIRAPFHEPRTDVEHEIVIMPKMSFGTGHHATTHLMLDRILSADLREKTGLDMGSGTGVLAILAVRAGAAHVDAIDIDEWAYENCVENIEANGVAGKITTLLGDASLLTGKDRYDFILANINRNILLNDMDKYGQVLKSGGEILFSGFLEIDVKVIEEKAASQGLMPQGVYTKDGWASVRCVKR